MDLHVWFARFLLMPSQRCMPPPSFKLGLVHVLTTNYRGSLNNLCNSFIKPQEFKLKVCTSISFELMGFRIAVLVLTGKNKGKLSKYFCASTGFPEVFLLICLSMGELILTVIQSRFTVITFPIKSSYDADQFSKLSWELSSGDFHLCLMWPCDSALFPRRPFTVTWGKPLFYFFFCHAALKEINILWSIKEKQDILCTYDVFKSVLSRKETIWSCCALRYPHDIAAPKCPVMCLTLC